MRPPRPQGAATTRAVELTGTPRGSARTHRVELVDTPRGPARLHHVAPAAPGALTTTLLVLGHGAGGSISAPDLGTVAGAAAEAGAHVLLVEQPYRVAGRRTAPPAPHLDDAWLAVLAHVQGGNTLPSERLVVGGRSSGARVACRTARATGADAVLALAFPLLTPKGASRQDELDGAGVPLLVVQGRADRFGMPTPDPERRREVVEVDGDHGLKRDTELVAAAATAWLTALTQSRPRSRALP